MQFRIRCWFRTNRENCGLWKLWRTIFNRKNYSFNINIWSWMPKMSSSFWCRKKTSWRIWKMRILQKKVSYPPQDTYWRRKKYIGKEVILSHWQISDYIILIIFRLLHYRFITNRKRSENIYLPIYFVFYIAFLQKNIASIFSQPTHLFPFPKHLRRWSSRPLFVVIWRFFEVCYITTACYANRARVVIWRFFEVCYISQRRLCNSPVVVIRRFFEVCYINSCFLQPFF